MRIRTVSIRLAWPFARVMRDYQAELQVLREEGGIAPDSLADPDLRIPESLAIRLLEVSLRKTQDPTLGLRAGMATRASDLGIVDSVARNAQNFRQALGAYSRYMCLLDEGIEVALVEEGALAKWQLRFVGMRQGPASNDFALTAAMRLGQKLVGKRYPPSEVRFTHAAPDYAQAYQDVFRCPVYFGQSDNALLMPRAAFDLPLSDRNRDLFSAFDAQAERLLSSQSGRRGVTEHVQAVVGELLEQGPAGMPEVSRRLNMSVATLRRRLQDEGTTHRHILEGVRRTRALQQLSQSTLTISQIAFSLGFSSPQAFGRAFRRWTRESPAEHRGRLRAGADDANT